MDRRIHINRPPRDYVCWNVEHKATRSIVFATIDVELDVYVGGDDRVLRRRGRGV